jgi:hypothetical protein
MRQFVKALLTTTLVVGAALMFATTASAGIANTKHNLGSSGSVDNNNRTNSTGEICIFCHTPHGADTGESVPLWNKVISSSTFTTYDQLGTSTLDAGITSIGSISIACLTCHDGAQAIDNILNAPGSGGYDLTGGGRLGLAWDWDTLSGPNQSVDSDGLFLPGAIANIGTDLRNDHPVSVQYGGGGKSAANPGAALRDGGFVDPQYDGSSVWWVDNTTMELGPDSTSGTLDKWDFKLYTRSATGAKFAGGPEPFVECGSCHDPHLETTTFLRIDPAVNPDGNESNSGSRICLSCHVK